MTDTIGGTVHVIEHNAAVYLRTWRGSVIVSFVSPVLFLAAMGIGLGDLVHNGRGQVAGVSYLRFLAPGLMAATAMQTAGVETTYPIMAKVHWQRIYEAMLATPLTVRDLLIGELGWILCRLLLVSSVFFVVMLAFGVVRTPLALLAVPVAVLTGLAFAAPILAFTATQRRDSGFAALNRFIILPLFLLSGPFFPIEQLPGVFQAIAWCAPLAHGVALCRGLVLGTLDAGGALVHLVVPAAYAGAGIAAARATLRRRLVT